MMFGGGFSGGGSWMARGGSGSYGRGMAGRLGLDQEEEDGQIYDHAVVKQLSKYMLPYWPRLLLTLAAIIIYTGTVVAIPWLIGRAVKYMLTGDPSELSVMGTRGRWPSSARGCSTPSGSGYSVTCRASP